MIYRGRLVFNENKDEGEVLIDTDFFYELHPTTQLDVLSDWICYLKDLYKEIQTDPYEERQCLLLEND
jgi:dihydroneopterin aldolase